MTNPVSQSLNGAQNSINTLKLRQNTVSSVGRVALTVAAIGAALLSTGALISSGPLLLTGVVAAVSSVCFVGIKATYDQHIAWREKERGFRSELEKILNSWASEITDENRQEAKLRIENFLNDESKNILDLSSLSLTSLPPIFNADPFIKRLTKLDISNNRLTSLPGEIGGLRALKDLHVSSNQLTSLPAEIGRLQALQELSVSSNQLTSLPAEIGGLKALKGLYAFYNQMASLPAEIGGLQALRRLYISHNNTMTGVPREIFDLPSGCEITLDGVGLSEAVLARLRETCSAGGYQGYRISFSMVHAQQAGPSGERSIEELLGDLFKLVNAEPKEFSNLLNSSDENKCNLKMWLARLSITADYNKGGESRKAFAGKVLKYLHEAEDDEQFREVFFNTIAGAAQSCGDRVALSILHVSTAFKLAAIDAKEISQVADLLIKGVWPLQLLEEIARNKVPVLRFYDEIEVYLGYPVMLQKKLGIPSDVEEMLYFRCSALTQNDLDEASEFVLKKQNDDGERCRFLITQEKWLQALQTRYPEEWNHLEKEIENAIESCQSGSDYEKLAQLRSDKRIELTKRALTAIGKAPNR